MDKSTTDEEIEALTKDARSEGEKHSKINRCVRKRDLDNCRKHIVNILKDRESLELKIYRIILRREEMSRLEDFTDVISSGYADIANRANALNPELFNDELVEEMRRTLLEEITRLQEDILEVKADITWTKRMLADTEMCLTLEKREYEALFSCLDDALAVIAQTRGDATVELQ